MIRIERDGGFWAAVAAHPALAGGPLAASPEAVRAIAMRADALPLAAEHGGYIFLRADALGFVAELHTLFTPEGWGREALAAGIAAVGAVWALGFQLITTFEVEGAPRSRPPRSFGFTAAGDWREGPAGRMRLWTLSRAAWTASPAIRRRSCPLPSSPP